MDKKGTKIAYFVACAVFVVLLVVLGISFKGAPLPEFVIDGETVQAETPFAGTFWSLLPPIVAIVLALISKEVYSSLFLGCLVGALLYTQCNPLEHHSRIGWRQLRHHIRSGGRRKHGHYRILGSAWHNGRSDEQGRRKRSPRPLG